MGGFLRGGLTALACAAVLWTLPTSGETVPVRYVDGDLHGFLILKTLDGNTIAEGDSTQKLRGDQVTSRLVFHFKDGSLYDETTVYSQSRVLRLVREHVVQKGPSFRRPMDISIDGRSGHVIIRYTGEHGEQKTIDERMKLPPDVANGLISTLVKNLPSKSPRTIVSMVAATPKPRLVKLAITPQGEDTFSIAGGAPRKAAHYVVKIEIGGIAGVVAPLIGRQPADLHVWMLGGEAPAFVRWEGPLADGEPSWRIELASPAWPRAQADGQR